ncbi:hypothetical protein [Nocardia sp. NPDC004415]
MTSSDNEEREHTTFFSYSEKPEIIDIQLILTHPHLKPEHITTIIGVEPSRIASLNLSSRTPGRWTRRFSGYPAGGENPMLAAVAAIEACSETLRSLTSSWRNQHAGPIRDFAVGSKIRRSDYLPNVA